MGNLLPTLFIVLGALSLLATLYFLWQSLREALVHAGDVSALSSDGYEYAALLAEKQALLLALKELEAEREAGKLGEEDYAQLNTKYRARAREVLRVLDTELSPHREAARALLAQAKAGQAKAPSQAGAPAARTDTEGSGEAAVGPLEAAAAIRCKRCGAVNDGDALYCKRCGNPLREEAPV